MGSFKGILGRTTASQVAEFEQQDYAFGQSNKDMGQSAVDGMQLVDRKYNELLSVFNLEKLRETLVAFQYTENAGADLIQQAMQDKSSDRDRRTMFTFVYVWEKSFLELYERGALNRCFADDLDPENLPQVVHDQLNKMVANVAEYERTQAQAARTNAAPKLSQADLVALRAYAKTASMASIRKRCDTDVAFAAFAEKELGLSPSLIDLVGKYEITPSARLRPTNGKVTLGDASTGTVELTKEELDLFLSLAEKARLI
jgi:hypothetical protein